MNKEGRQQFDESFMKFRTKFNINLSSNGARPKQGFNLFEVFFDVERLAWGSISEKLEYRLRLHYDQHM